MNWIKPSIKRNGITKQDRCSIAKLNDNAYLKIDWVGSGKRAYALLQGTLKDGQTDRTTEQELGRYPSVTAAKAAAEGIMA